MIKKYQHIIYGLLFAFIWLFVGIYLLISGSEYGLFVIYGAPLAGFLIGTLFGYLIIIHRNINNYALAIIMVALTVIVSLSLLVYAFVFWVYPRYSF